MFIAKPLCFCTECPECYARSEFLRARINCPEPMTCTAKHAQGYCLAD